MSDYHRPVMLGEVIDGLHMRPHGVYFDGTLGGGGHSYAILEREATARLIATDRDAEAIEAAQVRLREFAGRYEIFHTNFKDYQSVLKRAGVTKLDGFLLDLGISSHQIDDEKRGFAYRMKDAPLDMRMDQGSSRSARDVVNGYSEDALCKILREYGEERFARLIARNIIRYRETQPIQTCGQLRDIVEQSIPAKFRGAACARQSFQAIRIEVNDELNGLSECVTGLVKSLKKGGRGCVLTFHSLEDRIVKRAFRALFEGCICPKEFPVCVCNRTKQIELIGRYTASEAEREENSRSSCAKLRVVEKITE